MMQEDSNFKKYVQQSFILRKYNDIQIPLLPKVPSYKAHLITSCLLSTATHLALYPFDTIKSRMISKNKINDVAYFTQNKAAYLSFYQGIMRGYGSLMIGSLCHLYFGMENYLKATISEGLLKTLIDMSKISKQMGNKSIDMEMMKKSFGICAFYGVLRDLIYRFTYFEMYKQLHASFRLNLQSNQQKVELLKEKILFSSVIVSTILSQPLEVCFVKAASQRTDWYSSIIRTPKKIFSQEGTKLFFGGLWPRLAHNLISALILFHSYDKGAMALTQIM